MTSARSEAYEFNLKAVETDLRPDEARQRLQQALSEAIGAAVRDEQATVEAKVEIEGAFGGAIALAYLVFKVVAAKAGTAFVGGVAGTAGKHFYDAYLKPRLESRHLFPSGFKKQDTQAAADRKP